MRLELLGVRGSTPSPGHEFAATGGNTTCVTVSHSQGPVSLALDAGTGLRRLSGRLGGAPFRGTLLLTHLHWDHVQGLPFFAAGDRDDADVHLVMPDQGGGTPVEVLSRVMSPPHFPIGPGGLRGAWRFEGLAPGRHRIEGFDVLALEIAHKGGRTFGYRIEDDRSSMAFLPDHALVGESSAPTGRDDRLGANALALVDGVDVLVHDAQFTEAERRVAVAFGHATVEAAVALAERGGVGRLVLFHHGPDRTDDQLGALLAATNGAPGRERPDMRIELGTESTVLDLGGSAAHPDADTGTGTGAGTGTHAGAGTGKTRGQ